MTSQLALMATVAALTAAPMAAHAVQIEFTATLAGSNEVPPNGSSANGTATLVYDTDANTYDFGLFARGLSGASDNRAARAFHLHALATSTQNSPVRVSLDAPPFTAFNFGDLLLVTGDNVATPGTIPAGNGHPSMSFLEALQSGLVYVNVHTDAFLQGEIRGQLIPEPSTYALLLVGVAAVGVAVRRGRSRGG